VFGGRCLGQGARRSQIADRSSGFGRWRVTRYAFRVTETVVRSSFLVLGSSFGMRDARRGTRDAGPGIRGVGSSEIGVRGSGRKRVVGSCCLVLRSWFLVLGDCFVVADPRASPLIPHSSRLVRDGRDRVLPYRRATLRRGRRWSGVRGSEFGTRDGGRRRTHARRGRPRARPNAVAFTRGTHKGGPQRFVGDAEHAPVGAGLVPAQTKP